MLACTGCQLSIQFKILLFTYKIINNLALSYFSELLRLQTPVRALTSATQLLLEQPRSRLKSWGDRAFAVAAPVLWNNLPVAIRASDSMPLFKSRLKTYLFNLAFPSSQYLVCVDTFLSIMLR